MLSEVMWTRQGRRLLCKLAIVCKCLYNMYALLFLVSVLFDDWRIQKEFFNQCAVLCVLWMCNCWWFDTSFCRMIHMFMLGFIGFCEVFLYYCLQFYVSFVTFYIDLLAFFSVFLCMLNSSHSTSVFIMPFKSSIFHISVYLCCFPFEAVWWQDYGCHKHYFHMSCWRRMEEEPF